mgnify:CR=1 FL=1
MNIITGYTGTPHITSLQDRAINQGTYGQGSYIVEVGNKLAAELISSTEIRIRDGVLTHQGCAAIIEPGTYDSVEISNGSQGMERVDLIVARYERDAGTNVEGITLTVIEGTAVSEEATAPAYNEGDIQEGDSPVDMPLYYVNISGVNVSSIKRAAVIVPPLHAYGRENAGAHNAIYRGKYLGDSVTTEQWDEINAGTFNDLYIGDYWTINSVNWRIAAFDYWLNSGDTNCTKHHVVIVPDTNLATCQMNSTNITTGAYVGSDFYTGNNSNTGFATAKSAVNSAFGSTHVLKHRILLKNAVSNGYASGYFWTDSTVDLMSEKMVYGTQIYSVMPNGSTIPAQYTVDKTQLPLFALEPSRISNRSAWWLRSVVSASSFACVGSSGNAGLYGASTSGGVRPAFGIVKS